MKNSKKIAQAALATVVSLGVLAAAQPAFSDTAPAFAKCYGVAAAGKNDCGTGLSACAASVKTAGECYAWIYLPKGVCEKIVNASVGKPAASCKEPDGKPATAG